MKAILNYFGTKDYYVQINISIDDIISKESGDITPNEFFPIIKELSDKLGIKTIAIYNGGDENDSWRIT